MLHTPPPGFGLAIIPHGRPPLGGGRPPLGGFGEIPYLTQDGRAAYGLDVPGDAGELSLFLGPQPAALTLGQRTEKILTHPATGWVVAAALLGAFLMRRSGQAAYRSGWAAYPPDSPLW